MAHLAATLSGIVSEGTEVGLELGRARSVDAPHIFRMQGPPKTQGVVVVKRALLKHRPCAPLRTLPPGGQGILELESFRANLELQFYRFVFIFKAMLAFGEMRRFIYKTTRR